MDFINEDIMEYAESHTQKESQLLKSLFKETHQKILQPRMLSGHLQGRFLSLLSKLKQPHTILEIGTFTGYSSLCLAEGLEKGGTLHTIEIDEELLAIQKKYFKKSIYNNQIKTHLGDAKKIIPALEINFDMVFMDADKANYCNYLDLVLPKLNPGSLIIADNVLWSGKILKKDVSKNDRETSALKEFNRRVKSEKRFESLLVPIRDGLMVCRKI